jgi:Tol biopolymer transport system component
MRLVATLIASIPLLGCSASLQRPVVTTEAATDLTQITSSRGNEIDPSVSPDGKAIAYAVATAADARSRVEVASLANPKQLLYTSNEVLGRNPTWMPDSSGIVFVSRLTPNAPEKLVQTFGQNEHRPVFLADVGNPNFVAVRPAVSKSGKVAMSIAGVGFRNPGWPTTKMLDYGIGITDLGGHGMDVIGSGTDPAWSPDGKMIAFAQQSGGHEHLFVANADGSNRRQVTDGTADDEEPSWSPDGKRIVFCSAHGTDEWTQANLFVVRPDGSGLVQLTEGDHLACHPTWTRDGYVYFHANVSDHFHIWRIRVRLPDDPAT